MNATHQVVAIMFTDIEGYTALKQKDEQAAITAMGLFNLKNVSRPVEIFAITNECITVLHPYHLDGKTTSLKNKLAMPPFVNMSNDADNEYFSDGITGELINVPSKIDGNLSHIVFQF